MAFDLTGRTALVTASSKGIGKACALQLASQGANVVMCARGADLLAQATEEVRAAARGGAVWSMPADLTSHDDILRLADAIDAKHGGVDVLVAIGGSPKRGGFDEIDEDDLRAAFEMSVIAITRLLKRLLPGMRARGWGRIVTVQSRSVREPIPDLVTSAATRPGVHGLFKYLSKEVAADGVLLNTIVPGRIMTDRFRGGQAHAGDQAAEYTKNKLSGIPVGRFGEPEDIAAAVGFLCSNEASYINGVALPVDGGVINGL
ncbi:MAG: SDR family oxidoreductase [Pigmentiphaga sp.]|uniref:SDR family oxidoreductase n=1 Tax=Pigmentiphaga sp. TaxID=1977564 RepID=UPI0029B8C54B|nr:SDR family oxidoreductase [Pigmentiphaga sp.]MDX3904656.1 SDR family oxidoreductase [Pigmentiphaga sp.]